MLTFAVLRTELVKNLRRTRTYVAYGILALIPIIMAVAIDLNPPDARGEGRLPAPPVRRVWDTCAPSGRDGRAEVEDGRKRPRSRASFIPIELPRGSEVGGLLGGVSASRQRARAVRAIRCGFV